MRFSPMTAAKVAIAGVAIALPFTLGAAPSFGQFGGAILQPIVTSWIRSEVDSVDNLKVNIQGPDNKILSGTIPEATVSGDNLLYEGFKVSRVELNGENIQLNVAEALQNGGELTLKEPVPVNVNMQLTEADLNESLQAPLIQTQLDKAQVELPIGNGDPVPFRIRQPQVKLLDQQLQIDANVVTPDGTAVPVSMVTGVLVLSTNQLQLVNPNWLSEGEMIPVAGLSDLVLDLGEDVSVDSLALNTGSLDYTGILTVQP